MSDVTPTSAPAPGSSAAFGQAFSADKDPAHTSAPKATPDKPEDKEAKEAAKAAKAAKAVENQTPTGPDKPRDKMSAAELIADAHAWAATPHQTFEVQAKLEEILAKVDRKATVDNAVTFPLDEEK